MKKNALVLCAALATLAAASLAPPARAAVKLSSPDGIYHSAHPDFGVTDDSVSVQNIADFERLAGKKIVWAYLSWNWGVQPAFPSEECRALHGAGVVPLVGMMPWSSVKQGAPEPLYTMEAILEGRFDGLISRAADEARALRFPIMIEFGPEANGSWFPWSGAWNGRDGDEYGERGVPDGPERFRDAYRRIIGIFRARGADDVTWVFHIAQRGAPPEAWNSASYYYPGDEWIDWIGASVYGGGESFEEIMKPLYPGLCALSPSKPIALLEIGASGPEKTKWTREAFLAINSGKYPRLKAVSWWNKPRKPDGTPSGLEIDGTPESLSAYRDGVRDFAEEPVWRR
ncbi:MAG: beta-mannanase [Synergistaceae bacterium]|nr:beta-mannanase [Synergistaceae bacterium]